MYKTKRYVSIFLIITCIQRISGLLTELERIELCRDLQCNDTIEQKVCGVRITNGELSYKLFDNECLLLQYGCLVDDDSAYGIINIKYCDELNLQHEVKENCPTNCLAYIKKPVCGIRNDGEGFRIKIFINQCELSKYNCEQNLKFDVIDYFICDRNSRERRHSEGNYSGLFKVIPDEAMVKAKESNNAQINISKTSTESINELKLSEKQNYTEGTNNFKTGTTKSDDIQIFTIYAGEIRTNEEVIAAPKAKNKKLFKNVVVVRGSRADMLNINRTVEDEVKGNCPTNCLAYIKKPVCGIRNDGEGFRIRIFMNQCELFKYNCEQNLKFNVTDFSICDRNSRERRHSEGTYSGLLKVTPDEAMAKGEKSNNAQTNNSETSTESINELKSREKQNDTEETNNFKTDTTKSDDIKISTIDAGEMRTNGDVTDVPKAKNKKLFKNVVVVRGSRADMLNINRTVEDFFRATHEFDLPIHEKNITERSRRMLVKIFGPVNVYTPWVKIPKDIKTDYYHEPTLRSCYHRCPTKCPDTYAPVCGMPGRMAREPSLMFQNHCFMDAAQCKMYYEQKSPTALSSAYIESTFIFCLGTELGSMYKFLPLIRTLQHMGRLRKKGDFRMKISNMKFFHTLLNEQPRIMGR